MGSLTIAGGGIVIANFIVGALGAGNTGIYFITGIIVLLVGVIILASNAMKRPEK